MCSLQDIIDVVLANYKAKQQVLLQYCTYKILPSFYVSLRTFMEITLG